MDEPNLGKGGARGKARSLRDCAERALIEANRIALAQIGKRWHIAERARVKAEKQIAAERFALVASELDSADWQATAAELSKARSLTR